MTKNLLLIGGIIGVFVFGSRSLHARFDNFDTDAAGKPVVVELFTSQSCSSCPPADENLQKLAANPNIIALGFHVTYWDHLNWKDTLSHQFATDRQRAYSRHSGKSRVYTPQMIVNGVDEFVGSRRGDIAEALENADPVETIAVSITENRVVNVDLPAIDKGTYTLWVAGIKDRDGQAIASGENRGRDVTYTNAVLAYTTAGEWTGDAETRHLEGFNDAEIDRYVVWAQESGYGAIKAAGQTPAYSP